MPDGETGPRSDWILWQYPVFSARPQFEVGPPGDGTYRTLPKLRLRAGDDRAAADVRQPRLRRHRDRVLHDASRGSSATARSRAHCRFQLSLPTPLAPISAFVAAEHQARARAALRGARARGAGSDPRRRPARPARRPVGHPLRVRDARGGRRRRGSPRSAAGVLERLLRLSRHVPAGGRARLPPLLRRRGARALRRRRATRRKLVEVANALVGEPRPPAQLGPHAGPRRPCRRRLLRAAGATSRLQPETELYLGARARRGRRGGRAARGSPPRAATSTASASPPTAAGAAAARRRSTGCSRCTARSPRRVAGAARRGRRLRVAARASSAVPDEDVDDAAEIDDAGARLRQRRRSTAGTRTSTRRVEELAAYLRDGDILMDYSGGTGILLDRLRLRIFDRPVGVAHRRRVGEVPARRAREVPRRPARGAAAAALRPRGEAPADARRGARPALLERGVDAIAAANAIHLYPDLDEVAATWVRALRPGGRVFINSGNLRNPRAAAGRVDPRRDGVGDQRPRRGARAQRPALRAVPPRARRRRAHGGARRARATACSSSRARSQYYTRRARRAPG